MMVVVSMVMPIMVMTFMIVVMLVVMFMVLMVVKFLILEAYSWYIDSLFVLARNFILWLNDYFVFVFFPYDFIPLHLHLFTMFMNFIGFMAVLHILVIDQALDIFAHHFITHFLFIFNWEFLTTTFSHQAVRMRPSGVQNEVHDYIDWKSSCSHN